MQDKLYSLIANELQARINCVKSSNQEWFDKHTESIERLVKEHMPSGSGIDTGTSFLFDESTPNRLVFSFSYHHMDENGYYDGWTDHKLTVTPSLISGFDMRITGRDRNNTKEYLYDVFHFALSEIVDGQIHRLPAPVLDSVSFVCLDQAGKEHMIMSESRILRAFLFGAIGFALLLLAIVNLFG